MDDDLVRRMRAARAYAGLTRDALADSLGMSLTTYDRIERSKRDLKAWERPALIDGVAKACGLPPWWFTADWDAGGAAPPEASDGFEQIVTAVVERLATANGTAPSKPPRGRAAGGKRPTPAKRAPRAR